MRLSFVSRIFIALVFCSISLMATAQRVKHIDPDLLNNYIQFNNESVHGLLIIHRLLELYNQEINKYVDLPNYQLNLFSNADFPENIFQDQSGNYYRISPYEWFNKAKEGSAQLPPKIALRLNNIIDQMKEITDQLEKDRYSIGTLIESTDKTHLENLANVYAALDACVVKYDNYEAKRKELSSEIGKIKADLKINSFFDNSYSKALQDYAIELHNAFNILRLESAPQSQAALKNLLPDIDKYKEEVQKVKSPNGNTHVTAVINDILKALDKQKLTAQRFINDPTPPEAYKLYGACYYFYNTQLAGTTNKYGTGVIERSNELNLLTGNTEVNEFERPHFFKVIRPEKKIEVPDTIAVVVPADKVELNRKVIFDRSKTITSLTQLMLIEVYDHEEFDHDTISLNFNGKWVLRNQLITKEPLRLYLPLVKGQDNYLILHAENLGDKPPNTCAIKYQTKSGKFDYIILHSDYNQSEMIKIKYD